IPWEDDLPFILGEFCVENNSDFPVCPRSLLKRITKDSADAGYLPLFSQEFEWFNYKETPEHLYQNNFDQLQHLTSGMFGYSILKASEKSEFFHDLWDSLEKFGVPLEGLHTETGPGVYEAAIQYTDIREA